MQAYIDEYGFLALHREDVDTGKTYQISFQGYTMVSANKMLIVYHKKTIKLIELKNIGDTMGVFYVKEKAESSKPKDESWKLNKESCILAGKLFEAWDEEKGVMYHFLPYFPLKEVEKKAEMFQQLGIPLKVSATEKGVLIEGEGSGSLEDLDGREQIISFLFGLVLLFGKFESKEGQLNSIKIHLPLFGQYLSIQEKLEGMIASLQQQGIFLQWSKNEQQGTTSFQISSNDYELLQIFADWYKPVENFTQITKREQTAQAIQLLNAFVEQEDIENAEEVRQRVAS